MFRCGKCGELSDPGEKSEVLVLEYRDHVFPARGLANRWRDHGRNFTSDDPGGRGKQIVREVRVHRRCM